MPAFWAIQAQQQLPKQARCNSSHACRTNFSDELPAAAATGFNSGSYLVNGTGVVYDTNFITVSTILFQTACTIKTTNYT